MPEYSEKDALFAMRHSAEHLLTQAMTALYPEIKMAMGPAISDGFYFDYDMDRKINEADFKKIEKKFDQIRKLNLYFIKEELSSKELRKLFNNNEYKQEWIDEIEERKETGTVYWTVPKRLIQSTFEEKLESVSKNESFVDLCKGPHIEKTMDIGPMKLHKVAGAYWRGDEKNKMLQRIYGICFDTKDKLENYLHFLEEAKKRDHRKLGKELEIYTFCDEVGPGLSMWLPNGTIIRDELEKLAKEYEFRDEYDRVSTPHICKGEMYHTSGHLPYYKESMFAPMNIDGEDYYLKPMNCPHHHMIYKEKPRSYKDLPVRLAEYGQCYRYEQSGELFGLMRVRGFCMNDAHIYVTPDQVKEEFIKVIKLHQEYYDLLGITKVDYRLSLHSKEGLGKKYVDNEPLWIKSEEAIRQAMNETGMKYTEAEDEAAFYGPKVDVQIYSAIGKEYTVGTNQLDFSVPEKFGLTYIDSDGTEKTPLCIHRAPLSTHERFVGFLLEHFAGNFPIWLAPIQIKIIPVSDKHLEYAKIIEKSLRKEFVRVSLDDRNESVSKKIREAEKSKVPYMLIIGDQEVIDETITIRVHGQKEQKILPLKNFSNSLIKEIKERK
jgi:threonyl-tRNA synthetase